MLDKYAKKLVMWNGKKFCENVKQTRPSQNQIDTKKSSIFYHKKIEKDNYETITFEKEGKYLK